MSLYYRSTRINDLAAAAEIVEDLFLYSQAEKSLLVRMGSELIQRDAATSSVVYEDRSADPVAFGIAEFVDSSTADHLQTYPHIFVGRSIFDSWLRGQSRLLEERVIADANATEGVNVLVIANGWAQHGASGNGKVYYDSQERLASVTPACDSRR
jgi:hypothetical protein